MCKTNQGNITEKRKVLVIEIMLKSLWGKLLLIIVIHNHGFITSGLYRLQSNRKIAKDNFMIERDLKITILHKGVINIQNSSTMIFGVGIVNKYKSVLNNFYIIIG